MSRAVQIQDELVDGFLVKIGQFVTLAQISRRGAFSVSKLSKAATGDHTFIGRATQKRTFTIRKYCEVTAYIETYDPRAFLPGIDEECTTAQAAE